LQMEKRLNVKCSQELLDGNAYRVPGLSESWGPMMCSGKREKPYALLPPEGSSMVETIGEDLAGCGLESTPDLSMVYSRVEPLILTREVP
jgi:hypothetical protein